MFGPIYRELQRGHVDKLEFPLHAQGVYHDLPGRRSVMGAARRPDPQHFHRVRTGSGPLCTRHPHVYAQKACCCAVAAKICGRPIRPCRHCSRDGAAPSLAGEHTDGLARTRLAGAAAAAPTAGGDPDHRGWQPGVSPTSRPPGQARFCRAESDKAPPCMRWRGLARPRRAKSASWLCWHCAPLAGAKHPCEGPVSRFHPRSRGRPRWCPFPAVEVFLQPPLARAQGPAASNFGFLPLSTRYSQH
jgi:hypothetical protein